MAVPLESLALFEVSSDAWLCFPWHAGDLWPPNLLTLPTRTATVASMHHTIHAEAIASSHGWVPATEGPEIMTSDGQRLKQQVDVT